MKVETFLDKMCQRAAAAQFIQKIYRGYRVRLEVIGPRMREFKRAALKNKATKILSELLI